VLAWLGGRQEASSLWLELGVIAVAGAALVALTSADRSTPPPAPGARAGSATPGRKDGQLGLVLCYGSFGFGYIVPATFLPAMARQQVSDPLVFGLTWPLFGLAAAVSVAASARWLSRWPRRRVWAMAQGTMALGTALPLGTQALWGLAVSAVLVGGTFMVATMAGLQLAREHVPANPTPLLARMTAAFAAGQIAGPLLVRALGPSGWAGWDALRWANAIATVLLVITAGWLWHDGDPPDSTPKQLATR
jgi:MFS family permease